MIVDSIKKMDGIINSLVSWLKEYPTHGLSVPQKIRIVNILERLKNSEAFSLEELETFKSEISESKLANTQSKKFQRPSNSIDHKSHPNLFFTCDGCKSKVLLKNKEKHRKKCLQWNKLHKRGNTTVEYFKYSEGTSPLSDLPGRNYQSTGNELKDHQLAERKADGSRDHFQIRDNGRFGSSSSYDDYGDESHA